TTGGFHFGTRRAGYISCECAWVRTFIVSVFSYGNQEERAMKNAVPIEATVNPSWCSGLLVLFAILLLGCLDSSDPTGGIDPPDPVGCLDPSDPTGCLDPSDSSDHAPEENPDRKSVV